jgi:hypothetical protein
MRGSTARQIAKLVCEEIDAQQKKRGGADAVTICEALGPALMLAFPRELPDVDSVVRAINAALDRLMLDGKIKHTPIQAAP